MKNVLGEKWRLIFDNGSRNCHFADTAAAAEAEREGEERWEWGLCSEIGQPLNRIERILGLLYRAQGNHCSVFFILIFALPSLFSPFPLRSAIKKK